jgi:hypothetical protein
LTYPEPNFELEDVSLIIIKISIKGWGRKLAKRGKSRNLLKPLWKSRVLHFLNKKKEKWQGSWDILLGILQSEIFKTDIEDDVKREEKIKEDSQLFQIKEEKRQAKKDRAKKEDSKKGSSEKGKKKFYCILTPTPTTPKIVEWKDNIKAQREKDRMKGSNQIRQPSSRALIAVA